MARRAKTRDQIVKEAMTYFVHTPDSISQSYVAWADERSKFPGIPLGVGNMNNKIIPAKPGDLISIVARPGHGKTSYMAWLAMQTAKDIIARGTQDSECVIYASYEQVVEEVDSFFQANDEYTVTDMAWGRAPIESIKRGAVARTRLPIWMMGDSVKHSGDRKRPLMTLKYLYGGVAGIYETYKIKPIAFFIDYLQVIPMEARFHSRTEQTAAAATEGKALAKRIQVPIFMGVQSTRDAAKRKDPIPTLEDSQWSSETEQVVDKQLSVFRPVKHYEGQDDVTSVTYNDIQYTITDSLFVIRLQKQRMDAGYGTFVVNFDPKKWQMVPMVAQQYTF